MSFTLSTQLTQQNPLIASTYNTVANTLTKRPIQHERRKSISWNVDIGDLLLAATRSSASSESSPDDQDPFDQKNDPILGKQAGGIPKFKRKKRTSSSSGLDRISKSGKPCKCFGNCCAASEDSDTDEHYDDFTPKKLKSMPEDEILGRLQQAVHELGHRPTNYDIETEILRWHRTLEIEQQAYEESGKPKFKYKWFRKNQYLTVTKLPLYSTNYENHRKLEVRLAEFRFGVSSAVDEGLGEYEGVDGTPEVKKHRQRKSYESSSSAHWRNDSQVFYANLALLCSASNFLRFPQACYANGGFTFLLTYILMIAGVGQPLLYFEMVLGQYSLHGPSGFAKLHPYAKGLPYAIAFVCIVFGTSRSVYLAYSMLYAVLSMMASPGKCGFWTEGMKCLPYESFEQHAGLIREERKNAHNISRLNGTSPKELVNIFSVELYFREVMLDSNWITGRDLTFVHWKLIVAYIIVCGLALIPMHYNITGRMMKRYLRYSMILPILVLILFLHQIFARGGLVLTAAYFVAIDTDHVSALSIWSEAFEMVLSTLGIGYGFHWFISGNIAIDYRTTYMISWRICGCAVLFGLMSSLVLFCEIGIVGEFTGDHSHYHVFFERLGISFVCYSGALLKLGGNTFVFILVFFMLFVVYGMWSQIIVADIILRWLEHGHIIKGTTLTIVKRKKSTLIFLISAQLVVLSPYCFTRGGSVLASENIFGGALAAYVVVLAELVIAVYLYGFARFLADLEIMIKTPLPALFQIQIRYIVIPTIIIFMLPMMVNVYLFPSIYWERNSLGWLFYFGLMANFAPVVILLIVGQGKNMWFNSKDNKVNPADSFMYTTPLPPALLQQQQRTKTVEEIKKRYPMMEPKFVSKLDAPSQQSHSKTFRSEIYNVVENNMEYVHKCQEYVKNQFTKLLIYKINQIRWLKLVLPILRKIKVKSFRGLVHQVMFAQKYHNDKTDIRFLNNLMAQMVNMTFFSAVRKLQRMPTNEMLMYLADELLKLTTFRHKHFTRQVLPLSSSSSDDSDSSNNSQSTVASTYSSHHDGPINVGGGGGGDEGRAVEIHRRLGGYHEKSPEECRTLLTIRLKRGLGLPHDEEMSVLKLLRRQRSKRERENSIWSMRDQMPIDHFIPSTIKNKAKERICYTVFHGIVIEGKDHFVLKRLAVPRPQIVRVTRSFVQSQPGDNLTDKFANIITKIMHRNIAQIVTKRNFQDDAVRRKLQMHFWRLADRVDDDVYDFLDRILTCVVVIISEADAQKKASKKLMYLTPRTRRNRKGKIKDEEMMKQGGTKRRKAMVVALLDPMDIKSMPALTFQQRRSIEHEQNRILLDRQPPDIRYHEGSNDNSEDSSLGMDDEDYWNIEVKSSSGSSSTLSPEDDGEQMLGANIVNTRHVSQESIATVAFGGKDDLEQLDKLKSKYFVANETLQHRNDRLLMDKSAYGIVGINQSQEDLAISLNATNIKHVSARKWKHAHDNPPPLYAEGEEDEAEGKQRKVLRFTDNEIRLHRRVDFEAGMQAVQTILTKSKDTLKSRMEAGGTMLGKSLSMQSIRHLLEREAEYKVEMKEGEIVKISKAHKNTERMEEKLRNLNPELIYIAFGKLLIVEHGVKLSAFQKGRGLHRFAVG